MDIGVTIPHAGPDASPDVVIEFCRRAEDAGFDGLWTIEHLAVPRQMASEYTLTRNRVVFESDALRAVMGENLEMVTTLAVAAAVTSRVTLGTSVAVLPLRNPVVNARQLATIQRYSGGRLLYGVGVGWLREEAEALDMPWDHRGARSEEHIAVLRALWSAEGEDVGFDGRFYSFPPIDPRPRPGHPIPVLIGGHSDIALDRAARIGDGWIAAGMSPERLEATLTSLRTAATTHGRQFSDLRIACSTRAQLDDDGGGVDAIVDLLRRYEDLGVHDVQVSVAGPTSDVTLDALSRWGDEVLPRLR